MRLGAEAVVTSTVGRRAAPGHSAASSNSGVTPVPGGEDFCGLYWPLPPSPDLGPQDRVLRSLLALRASLASRDSLFRSASRIRRISMTRSSSSPTVGGPVQPRRSANEKRATAPISILDRVRSHRTQIWDDQLSA